MFSISITTVVFLGKKKNYLKLNPLKKMSWNKKIYNLFLFSTCPIWTIKVLGLSSTKVLAFSLYKSLEKWTWPAIEK